MTRITKERWKLSEDERKVKWTWKRMMKMTIQVWPVPIVMMDTEDPKLFLIGTMALGSYVQGIGKRLANNN